MPTPTSEEIEAAIAEDAEAGIQSATSDGQSATAMSADDRITLADRKAAQENVTAGNAWGAIGRARAMPNWTE